MDRDTIDSFIGQLAEMIVQFERCRLNAQQRVAYRLMMLARAKLIEDVARLPSGALCEVQE